MKNTKAEKGEKAQSILSSRNETLSSLPDINIARLEDLEPEEIKEAAKLAFKAMMDKMDKAGEEYLLAGIALALDAVDEQDRYADIVMDDWTLVKESGWFDEAFYRKNHPELTEKTDLILHYLLFGYKENADPSKKFSTAQYKKDYPETCAYDMCPLVHYLRLGKTEGKQPKPSTQI